MNFSLNSNSNKPKKGNLSLGLNQRGKNVFGDDSDDDDDHDEEEGATIGFDKRRVNRQIVQEQAALRQQALALQQQQEKEASQSSQHANIYDYDGAYDTFSHANKASSQQPQSQDAASSSKTEPKKSRYIADLLKASKKRERERDAIYERKVAKEQAEEEQMEEFAGKEKFVTKAYRRKLEEREQWQAEQDAMERQESAQDVRKKTGGMAMASFYGNMSRNVAMGGADGTEKPAGSGTGANSTPKEDVDNNDDNNDDDWDPRSSGGMGFGSDFVLAAGATDDTKTGEESTLPQPPMEDPEHSTTPPTEKAAPVLSMRERRKEKIAQARHRYLQRKGLAAPSTQ